MNKLEIIRKIVEGNPTDANSWYLLGLEYIELGDDSEALKAFSESLKYSNDDLKYKIFEHLGNLSTNKTSSTTGEKKESSTPMSIEAEELDDIQQEDVDEFPQEFDHDINQDGPTGKNRSILQVIDGGKDENVIDFSEKIGSKITFKDVGGLDKLKESINMRIIKPFINPGIFTKFKKKVGGGILLYGPPGCGKTFIAKATAGEVNARFIPVHISDVLDPYLGMSERNLHEIFDSARLNKPSVLFFDEVDAIGYNRAKSSSHLLRPLVDQLLSEIEGIDSSTDQLLILGATNMPWDVDPAFKRPGRFDKLIFVPPPDEEARKTIFKLKLADKPTDFIDFDLLAKKTELYSGADIENVVEIATEYVIEEYWKTQIERDINTKDLLRALEETKPSTIEWLRTVKNYVKYSNQTGLYDDVEKYLDKYKKFV